MEQLDIDQHQNFNIQLELQYIQLRARQRRKKALLLGLAIFSIIYVLLQPNQYEQQTSNTPYTNATQNSTNTQNDSQKNETQIQIQNHFQLIEKLLMQQYEGIWGSIEQKLNELAEANFFKTSYQSLSTIQLQLKLIEGQFLEDVFNSFQFYLNQSQLEVPTQENLFIFTNVRGAYRRTSVFENDQANVEVIANLTMTTFSLANQNQSFQINGIFQLNEEVYKFYCKLQYNNIEDKALIYSIIVSVLNLVQFSCCLKLMKDFMNDGRQANQFSLFIFVFLMIFDGYLGIVHFFLALQSEYYLTPAFLELILFFFLELKLAMHIWKERFMSLQDTANIRRELYKFYIKFYLFAMLLVLLLYYLIYYNTFLILLNLYLIPQIIHVAYRGSYVEFDKFFVYGLLATRLFIPLYYRGCPLNVLHTQTSLITCVIIILLFIVQVVIYYYQCNYGPRFFLPKFLKPRTHEYFVDSQIEGECAICIASLNETPQETQLDNKIIARMISNHRLMETPCGHHFHAVCLTKWMNVKLNCPTCRQILPPII